MSAPSNLELLNETREYLETLKSLNDYNVARFKILLAAKTRNLMLVCNQFLTSTNSSQDNIIENYFEIIQNFVFLENKLAKYRELDEFFQKITALNNMIRSTLLNTYFNSEIIRNYSIANLLSNLLINPEKTISPLPQFPPFKEFGNFLKAFGLSYNTIHTKTRLFVDLIQYLPIINQTQLDEWMQTVLVNQSLIADLIKIFDIQTVLRETKITETQKFYSNTFTLMNAESENAQFFIEAPKYYGGDWPEYILELIPAQQKNVPPDSLLNNLVDNHRGSIDILEVALKNQVLNPNDRYEKTMFYAEFQIINMILKHKASFAQFYQNPNQSEEFFVSLIDDYEENFLPYINSLFGDMQAVLKSHFILLMLDTLEELMLLTSQLCLKRQNIEYWYSFCDKYREIIDFTSFQDRPEFRLHLLLCEIYIKSKLNSEINFHDITQDLQHAMSRFMLSPRTYIAVSFLRIIATYLSGRFVDFEVEKKNLKEYGFVEQNESKYTKQALIYLEYLIGKTHGGEVNELSEELKIRQRLIPFDPYSLYCFTVNNITYVPFNRSVDKIIE